MAYKYEVFISYRHETLSKEWIHKWFLLPFKEYFESLFQKSGNIVFIDSTEIPSGAYWDEKIKDALLHSKLMISFWTPKYFNDDSYALKELAFIDYRQRKLNLGIGKGLVVPIRLRGDYSQSSYLQYLDYNEHCIRPDGKIPKKLDREIKRLADEIFSRLEYVPDWVDDLASDIWLHESEKHISVVKSLYKSKPWGCPSIA